MTHVVSLRLVRAGRRRVFRLWKGALVWPIEQLAAQQTEGQGLGMFTLGETKALLMAPHDRVLLRELEEARCAGR
jgi:hypothetical protein